MLVWGKARRSYHPVNSHCHVGTLSCLTCITQVPVHASFWHQGLLPSHFIMSKVYDCARNMVCSTFTSLESSNLPWQPELGRLSASITCQARGSCQRFTREVRGAEGRRQCHIGFCATYQPSGQILNPNCCETWQDLHHFYPPSIKKILGFFLVDWMVA